MKSNIKLKDCAVYVNNKVNSGDLSIEQYITTDNILQNKKGIKLAIDLPATEGNVTAYTYGDILIGNIRPYLRKIWYATNNGGCSADVLAIRAKEGFNNKFLYYALFRDDFFRHMMVGSKGTKMPRGDKSQILEFLIPNFDYEYQLKVSAILEVIDKKIDINNEINTKLEAIAKTLYDYWFVQFDFPDENGKPYKTSGGKMVYNKLLKREIPEGWEAKRLEDIANITMGQSPVGSSYNEEGVGTVFFQGSTDFGDLFPTIRQYTTEPNRMAKAGDILLSVRAPVGTINIANIDCCIGRGLAALNSKTKSDGFLFYVMQYFKQIFDYRNSEGTTFGSITKNDLHSLPLAYPGDELVAEYNQTVASSNQMIFKNNLENIELERLRGWLLPMLMNGQVTVGD